MLHGLKKKTRKKEHRIVSMLLIPSMLLTLCAGCGDNGTGNKESSGTGETEVSVTDEHYATYTISEIEDLNTVYCFDKTDDTYTVFGTDTSGTLTTLYKYTSSDAGLNWERDEIIGEGIDLETSDGLTKQITCADINSDGSIIIGYGASDSDGYVESYIIEKMSDGSTEEVATADANDTYIKNLRSSKSDGSVYVYFDESIIKYDESENLSYEINIPELIDYEIGDTEIYVLTEDALYTYDCETGEEISEDTGVTKALAEEISAAYENSQKEVLNCKRIIKLNENKDALYFMLEETIYSYDLENPGNVCQVDCDKKSSEYVYDFLVDETDSTNTKIAAISSGDEEAKLIAYSPAELETNYDEEENKYADEEPAEITVYSLQYTEDMEGLITMYENIHPNITVNYEYGVSDENGVTVSDAINALNTELMAGEGPDVILMDGLNVNDYAESGVLMELSDIYDEILEENPNCLENLMTAYETEDGLYAIPTSVKFSVIIAEEDVIDSLSDIDSLTEYVSTYEGTGVTNALNIYEWEVLFETYYPSYSNYIVDSEGNYNEEVLREFLEDIKSLWDGLLENTSDEQMETYEQDADMGKQNYLLYVYMTEMYNREYSGLQVTVGDFKTTGDVIGFYNIKDNEGSGNEGSGNEGLTYKIISNGDEMVYTPKFTFAINKNTEVPDAAASFFKAVFTVDVQNFFAKVMVGDLSSPLGISVNTDTVYDYNKIMYDDVHPYVEAGEWSGNYLGDIEMKSYLYTSDENIEELIDVLSSLDTPSNDDQIIYEAIEDGMAEYMKGTKSLDDTVSDISSTINIYVNE